MERYYYAEGERHNLVPDTKQVAIDTGVTRSTGQEKALEAVEITSKLPGGMVLVRAGDVSATILSELDRLGATQHVYRRGRTTIVFLPEVRVEFDDAAQRKGALEAAHSSGVPIDVIDDCAERLSLRPQSGSGDDALDLANFIYERAHPASASARMLQVVPRPATRKTS